MVSASDDHRPQQPQADGSDDDDDEDDDDKTTEPSKQAHAAPPSTDGTTAGQHSEQERDAHGAAPGGRSGNGSHSKPTAPTSAGDHSHDGAAEGASPTKSPTVSSPPYWTRTTHTHASNDNGPRQAGGAPSGPASVDSVLCRGTITLEDNEQEGDSAGGSRDGGPRSPGGGTVQSAAGRDRNRACWARSVEVTDYVMVNGSATNIGAFAVWNIRVRTLSGPYMNIRKRYSEFDDFRKRLIQTFPNFEAAVPELPPKSVMYRFRPAFLEKRRAGLQYFLKWVLPIWSFVERGRADTAYRSCILLNPEFSGSPVLTDFLFA